MLKSEKMSRMTISGHKKDLADLSKLLNDQNLVHVVDYNNEDDGFSLGKSLDYGEKSSDFLVKLRSVIKLLEVESSPPSTIKLDSEIESEISELDEIISQAHDFKEKERDCDRRIDEVSSSIDQLKEFEEFNIDVKYLSGYSSVTVFAGHLPSDSDSSSLASNKNIDFIQKENNVVVFCANEISTEIEKDLLNIGFRSMDIPEGEGLPKVMLTSLSSQLLKLEHEKAGILQEIEILATRYGDWLVACEEHYAALSEKSSLPLKLATSENMFVLDGWVPSDSVSDLQQSLQSLDIYYEVDNSSSDEPPIKLDNPEVAKPFELFTKLYSTPKHWEYDPTMIIFITYPLFFGLMVGDAGYGFAYILFGHYILTKFAYNEALANLGKILRTAGIYTFLFGTFIYAEAFGQSFYNIGNTLGYTSALFAKYYGPSFDIPLIEKAEGFSWHLPIHKFDPHGAQLMLLSSILIGVIHISLGLILGFLNEWKHHDLKHAIYAKLSFFMILWGGLLSLTSLVGLLPESFQTIGLVVMLTGLGLAIIGEGVVGLLEFPTIFSNVISYARIGAIGLSDYGLAYTVNFISFSLLWPSGPAGIIAAVFVMLIGHLTVFTLGIIGTGINSLRLQYVEFFTKFVQGGGTLYSPFGYIRKYTKEKEVTP